jgi:starch synthase
MSKKKVLIVTQEMQPYTALTEIAEIARKLPQHVQDNGMEIRVLMPRFGTINERRHRLHEVVRLSGMNIIVDDDDYPLIIKVASLPEARMQVYFLDNEDFFKRKFLFEDADGNSFEDNAERSVFFCKGVLETVKKFGWPPNIIHCHGWLTSWLPIYLKTAYKTEPLFQQAKVIYSAYSAGHETKLEADYLQKATINNLSTEELKAYEKGLQEGAIQFSDAVIKGSTSLSDSVNKAIEAAQIPVLEHPGEDYLSEYMDFYASLLGEEETA